jgi:tripartite-type tricarboxylate transporter receptor subunit TctC
MLGSSRTSVFSAVFALALLAPAAASAEDFYKGKTINIIVGFAPGGGYDLNARLLARYMGKYIPGNPNVVVQNQPGAGGVRAANNVYATAPQDGTVIAAVNQGAPMYQLLDGKGAQYDASKFQWLGSMGYSNNTVYVWHGTGVKTIEDAKKRPLKMAGSGIISDANIYPAILNGLLGTKFDVINGYTGMPDSNLALERGEVDGRGGGAFATLVTGRMDWLEAKKINVLVQIGFDKEEDLPDVPLLIDLVASPEEKQIATLVTLPTALGYNHWVGPGVPADRVEILRNAYAQTMKDPELIAEAKRQTLNIRPKTGPEIKAMVDEAAAIPQPILRKTAELLGW